MDNVQKYNILINVSSLETFSSYFCNLNPGQPITLLQLKLVGILMINCFLI
jgi:hypothetical protein